MKKLVLTLLLGVTTLTAFAQVPSNVPTNGLVGYWPFNGNANDESGNNLNGNVTGATLTSDRNGVTNKAYSFLGNESIIIQQNSLFNMGSNFTVSIWFTVNNFNNVHTLINKNISGNGNQDYFNLGILPNTGTFYTQMGDGINIDNIMNPNNTTINTWYNAIYTISDSVKLYLNGQLIEKHLRTIVPLENNNNISIGYWQTHNHTYHNGKLDDIGIWNRALTKQEITALYTGCTNPTATITPQSTKTICQGGSVVLNASIEAGYTYEWYKDGNIINGSTTSSYTANQSGSYTVKVINGSCNATSSATTVTVNPNPTAVINAAGVSTFCQGGSVILNASTGTGYTYEWYKNGNIINGSTTSSYTTNQSGSYTVKVINGSCNATSSATTVTVNPNPTVSLSLANFIHIKESPVTLAGSPSGGTYSGVGVVGSTFSSTNAGLGKKTITYNYTSGAGCSGSATAITTVYDTTACSTFDTLFINIAVAGLTAPNNLGTLKIWPNPTNDYITIDNGNYGILSGYSVKIETVLGQEVFKSAINQQQFSVDLTTWNGKGVYLVHILDNQNNIIETKKIVLQ